MGKRRYYCDYCDRSFIDDIAARKKHLNGVSHQRNRSLHYSHFRDLKTFVEEELKKDECFRFKNSGFCSFGDNCFRSHFTRQQLRALESQAKEEENFRTYWYVSKMGSIESWLETKNSIFFPEIAVNPLTSTFSFVPSLSEKLDNEQFLPPSLRRLRVDDISDSCVEEWG